MTDEEALALAVRLVACPHFRPMPGMRDLQGRTWTPDLMWRWNRTIDRPDLRDPATLGCLLALVREAWDCRGIHATRTGYGNEWMVSRDPWHPERKPISKTWGPYSEAEALVAALEAAP